MFWKNLLYYVIFHIFYFDTHSKLRNNFIELCCYQCEILESKI